MKSATSLSSKENSPLSSKEQLHHTVAVSAALHSRAEQNVSKVLYPIEQLNALSLVDIDVDDLFNRVEIGPKTASHPKTTPPSSPCVHSLQKDRGSMEMASSRQLSSSFRMNKRRHGARTAQSERMFDINEDEKEEVSNNSEEGEEDDYGKDPSQCNAGASWASSSQYSLDHGPDETGSMSHLTWDGPSTVSFVEKSAPTPPRRRRRGWGQNRPSNRRRSRQNDEGRSRSSLENYERVEIEVGPGEYKLLRGAKETMDAINSGHYVTVSCLSCDAVLTCIADCELVVCPDCEVMSPVEEAVACYNLITFPDGEADLVENTESHVGQKLSAKDQDKKEQKKAAKAKTSLSSKRSGVGLGLRM